jgi:hypothetical protein
VPDRWHNVLDPDVKKGTWTREEDEVIFQLHNVLGNQWAEIAKLVVKMRELNGVSLTIDVVLFSKVV